MGERLVTAHLEAAGGRAEAKAQSVSFLTTGCVTTTYAYGTSHTTQQPDLAGTSPRPLAPWAHQEMAESRHGMGNTSFSSALPALGLGVQVERILGWPIWLVRSGRNGLRLPSYIPAVASRFPQIATSPKRQLARLSV